MDPEDNTLCCGCLSSDRKMILQVEFWKKQTFLQILNEIPMSHAESSPVWLCWECDAQINSFTKYKQKVKTSYSLFYEYVKQNTSLPKKQPKPRLTMQNIFVINIDNKESTQDTTSQIIVPLKTERPETPEIPIKEECDTFPDANSDNDEILNLRPNKVLIGKIKKKKMKRKEKMFREIELSRVELEEERKEAMLKEDYVNAMFRCERCILSFPNAEDLKDHISIKHVSNASRYKCDICECSFSSEVSYNYHTNKHTRRYECGACAARCATKRAVLKHYHMTHYRGSSIEDDYQKQQQDGVTTDDADGADDNSLKQTSATFACEFCEKNFRWKASLRKHVETHRIETGQKRKPYCEPCKLSFTNTSNLQKHVKTSSKHQIQLKLRKLTESLPEDSSNLEKHQQRIEQIKSSVNNAKEKFPCPQCDKKFLWRGNLLRHVKSHAAKANGELVCEPCNRTFSSIATYEQHMKISRKHVSENDFKYMCSDCGKRFASKTRLKDHVDWEHLKNFVHTCPVCQKVFKSHTSLYLHKQVVHKIDNAEHLCDHCGKSFPNQSKLRIHIMALHSGQSAYKCTTCGARFSWHSCLSRHIKKLHPNVNKAD